MRGRSWKALCAKASGRESRSRKRVAGQLDRLAISHFLCGGLCGGHPIECPLLAQSRHASLVPQHVRYVPEPERRGGYPASRSCCLTARKLVGTAEPSHGHSSSRSCRCRRSLGRYAAGGGGHGAHPFTRGVSLRSAVRLLPAWDVLRPELPWRLRVSLRVCAEMLQPHRGLCDTVSLGDGYRGVREISASDPELPVSVG